MIPPENWHRASVLAVNERRGFRCYPKRIHHYFAIGVGRLVEPCTVQPDDLDLRRDIPNRPGRAVGDHIHVHRLALDLWQHLRLGAIYGLHGYIDPVGLLTLLDARLVGELDPL